MLRRGSLSLCMLLSAGSYVCGQSSTKIEPPALRGKFTIKYAFLAKDARTQSVRRAERDRVLTAGREAVKAGKMTQEIVDLNAKAVGASVPPCRGRISISSDGPNLLIEQVIPPSECSELLTGRATYGWSNTDDRDYLSEIATLSRTPMTPPLAYELPRLVFWKELNGVAKSGVVRGEAKALFASKSADGSLYYQRVRFEGRAEQAGWTPTSLSYLTRQGLVERRVEYKGRTALNGVSIPRSIVVTDYMEDGKRLVPRQSVSYDLKSASPVPLPAAKFKHSSKPRKALLQYQGQKQTVTFDYDPDDGDPFEQGKHAMVKYANLERDQKEFERRGARNSLVVYTIVVLAGGVAALSWVNLRKRR